MIKNIVFDVGNVLMDYDPDRFMDKLGFDEETKKFVNEAMFQNPIWNDSDRGVCSPEEMENRFAANNPGKETEIRKAYAAVGGTMAPRAYMVDWVKELKDRGYRLYILSNYAERCFFQTKKEMEFLPYMDGAVFSFQCHLLKPEPEIYEYLCSKFRLIPSECVFLDDREDNIQGAQRSGLYGIRFFDYEQAKKDLEDLLLKA